MTTRPAIAEPHHRSAAGLGALLCALSCTLGLAQRAVAQAYPAKPIRMLVGTAPGGPIDFSARLAAQKLTEALGQQVVVDNRTGASGTIATENTARATPDGYTLLMASAATLCITPHLYRKLPYDTLRDFTPISTVTGVSYLFVVHPALPAKSVTEFIALARSRPGQLRFGSAGSGSVTHLGPELFRSMAGIELLHVPYKGAGPARVDLLSSQLDFMFDSILTAMPLVKAGRLRALAQTGLRRSPLLPDLATVAESGLPSYESSTWFGVVGPAGLPRGIVAQLNGALVQGLANPQFRERLLTQGIDPIGNSPDEFAKLIRSELPRWGKIVRLAGAKLD